MRIFNAREGHSRDVYHTKRMQKIFCVKYTMDAGFVVSGSDDGNVRLWKNNASEKIGTVKKKKKYVYSLFFFPLLLEKSS